MKKDGLYRYCIQFPGRSEAEIRVGEFLERLGRKKGIVIIAALNEYLDRNPKLLESDASVRVQVDGVLSERLEQMIRQLIDEKLAGMVLTAASVDQQADTVAIQKDIMDMLGELELFQ